MTLRELLAGSTPAHRHAVAEALGLEPGAPAARIAETLTDEERLAAVVAGLSPEGRAAATAGAFAGAGAAFHASPRAEPSGVRELERHGLAYAFGRSWWREYVLPEDLLAALQRVQAAAHAVRIPDASTDDARFVAAPFQLAHDAAVLSAFIAREPVRVKADGQIYVRTSPKLAAALAPGPGIAGLEPVRVELALEWLRDEGLLRLRIDDVPGGEIRRELVAAGDPARAFAADPATLRERLTGALAQFDELRCALALARALHGRELPVSVFGETLQALLKEAGMAGHRSFEAMELALTSLVSLWLAGEVELGLDAAGSPVAARMSRPDPAPAGPGPLGVAQGNFELVLLRPPTPAERFELELCCERAPGQEHVLNITRAAARAAQRAGVGPAAALTGLVGELPQNVERSLQDWTRNVRAPLRLRSAMLVDAGDAASADALAEGALSGLVVERMGERMLAVRADRLDDVRRALRAAGAELEAGLDRVSGTWPERTDASEPAQSRWETAVEEAAELPGAQVSTIELDPPLVGVEAPVTSEAGVPQPLGAILDAIERDADIAIVYAGAGGVSHRVVTPVDVDGSRLHAYCPERDDDCSFWLSSILAVGDVPD